MIYRQWTQLQKEINDYFQYLKRQNDLLLTKNKELIDKIKYLERCLSEKREGKDK